MRTPTWRRLARPLRERLARRRWRSGTTLATSGAAWAVVAVLFAAVIILGHVGFTRYLQAHGTVEPVTSRLYLSLQLFALQSGAVPGHVPWELDLARFAAPMVAAYAVLQALAAVFRDQVASVRLRLRRDHVVVAGLGSTGWRLTQALLRRGERAVVIEADATNRELETVRSVGGLVVVGDARSPLVLRRAGVLRARRLVVLCGSDATNVEIVAAARELARQRRAGDLRCVVHLVDPELSVLLGAEELEHYGRVPMRVEFVDVHAAAARTLLRTHPPRLPDGAVSPVVIVGGGTTAREVLLALAREQGLRQPHGNGRLPVTGVGMDPAAAAALVARHPEVARFLRVAWVEHLDSLHLDGAPVAYVCPDDDVVAARDALELRGHLLGRPARIVIVLERRCGLGDLLQHTAPPEGGPSIVAFGLLDEACEPDVLLTGATEQLARQLHQVYLSEHADDDATLDPALRPWAELPESLRESNRDQATHVGTKLAAVGRTIGPLTNWEQAHRTFSDDEVEVMARLEHDRWVAERRRAGWQPGPRDPQRRTTPYLVTWEQLSDEVREYDRMFVRQLPRLLASAGLQALPRDVGKKPCPFTVPRRPCVSGRSRS